MMAAPGCAGTPAPAIEGKETSAERSVGAGLAGGFQVIEDGVEGGGDLGVERAHGPGDGSLDRFGTGGFLGVDDGGYDR